MRKLQKPLLRGVSLKITRTEWLLGKDEKIFCGVCRYRYNTVRKKAKDSKRRNTLPLPLCAHGQERHRVGENNVWWLHLATLGWEAMPALGVARTHHVCCVVQSSMAVIGGVISSDEDEVTGSVEMFAKGGVAVTNDINRLCHAVG
jgi:hypothetical protein